LWKDDVEAVLRPQKQAVFRKLAGKSTGHHSEKTEAGFRFCGISTDSQLSSQQQGSKF